MTHRQFLAWDYWVQEQWNKPSRADHYMMQMTHTQCRKGVKPEDLEIKFNLRRRRTPVMEDRVEAAKRRALSRMTMPVKLVKVDREGNVLSESFPMETE